MTADSHHPSELMDLILFYSFFCTFRTDGYKSFSKDFDNSTGRGEKEAFLPPGEINILLEKQHLREGDYYKDCMIYSTYDQSNAIKHATRISCRICLSF